MVVARGRANRTIYPFLTLSSNPWGWGVGVGCAQARQPAAVFFPEKAVAHGFRRPGGILLLTRRDVGRTAAD